MTGDAHHGQAEWSVSGDVMASHLDGETVLLDLGSKKYFRLNETGSAIWKGLESGLAEAAIVETLEDSFEVEESEARLAVRSHLSELEERGLVRRGTSTERTGDEP